MSTTAPPTHCPQCQNEDLAYTGTHHAEGSEAWIGIHCSGCGRTFNEVFTFSHVEAAGDPAAVIEPAFSAESTSCEIQTTSRGGLEVMAVLVLSTAHLTAADAASLDAGLWPTAVADDEYGYFLWAGDAGAQPKPGDFTPSDGFIAAIALAREVGCRYVRFDRDGPAVDGLPAHAW